MSKSFLQTETHEQSYLIEELQSLGFHSMRLNELNDNGELRNLIKSIKVFCNNTIRLIRSTLGNMIRSWQIGDRRENMYMPAFQKFLFQSIILTVRNARTTK